jgi:hypothetical protein
MAGRQPFAETADGVRLAVRLMPNAALLKLLARAFRLAPRDLAIVRGLTDRRKTVAVTGAPAVLAARISEGLRLWSRA